jgi:serine/threonine protein kinase
MALTGLTDLVGRVLADRYRLLAPIGAGASGRVYVAADVRLRRRVAVKVLHAALADDAGFLRRFRAEAQLAASLHHPNIMGVYDWGEDQVPFMVLELLPGGSLRGMLDEGIRLTPAQAAYVGEHVADALSYAHARRLVHRDIKPANLLFDEHGTVRVADFGLARALAEASWTEPAGTLVGTARYAAPEQGTGATLDGRADLYALAVVLVEAVTGKSPTRPSARWRVAPRRPSALRKSSVRCARSSSAPARRSRASATQTPRPWAMPCPTPPMTFRHRRRSRSSGWTRSPKTRIRPSCDTASPCSTRTPIPGWRSHRRHATRLLPPTSRPPRAPVATRHARCRSSSAHSSWPC